ncbi:MAG: ring-cleaving dioxygenase [Candidatus Dormibacteraeota bacterium]|nr:ring-cleaving dioxygenase [Candidatus Dormibacteraeota bacterium]
MDQLGGLHHVTAITGDARGNAAFYTGMLGMRLVKKSVNQDDTTAYHLFYADNEGSPGTDLTFFDWPATPANQVGVPSIGPIALRVASQESLGWWQSRFAEHGVQHVPLLDDQHGERLSFTDPEGQRLQLVVDSGAPGGRPWLQGPVPAQHQIRGLHGATLMSARPDRTIGFLVDVLGFRPRPAEATGGQHSFEVGAGGPGTELNVQAGGGVLGRQGRGGVHHVAFRVPDEAAQLEWVGRLRSAGLPTTDVIDRYYFKSVYFREPGGNLFELATDGPGFTVDEPVSELGQRLALPPFLEGRRREIEAGLQPIT